MKVHWRWITSPEQRLPDTMAVLAEAKKVGEVPAEAKAPRKPAARKLKKKTTKS